MSRFKTIAWVVSYNVAYWVVYGVLVALGIRHPEISALMIIMVAMGAELRRNDVLRNKNETTGADRAGDPKRLQ
jgi:hypothetical protein